MPIQPSDGQLVTQLQAGDLEALGVLYDRHRTMVYRTALKVTRDPGAAEDILQDCFLRVHKYAHSIDSTRPFQPWLYWVTVHRACDWETSRTPRPTPLDGFEDRLVCPNQYSPEWHAEKNDIKTRVSDAISTLSNKQRVVIILYYLCSLDLKEIAGVLNCPVGTVKSRLHYGRENLHHQMVTRFQMAPDTVREYA